MDALIGHRNAFRDVSVAKSWAGMIDVMPDAIPVISGIDKLPRFFIATGFSGHGFGIGPGAGRLMADMVMDAPPQVGSTPLRSSRLVSRRLEPEASPLGELKVGTALERMIRSPSG
jgi:glycine/D-amino acid oxidase-like deaminating enzyme